jgi:uncharacterized RDD family membrane protein YckC
VQSLSFVGLWKRTGAFLIDLIILYTVIPFCQALILFFCKIPPKPPSEADPRLVIIMVTIFIMLTWLYFAISESSKMQASLGKRLFRIMVVDVQGNRITFFQASLRFFGKLFVFPILSLTRLIAHKRPFYDMMAKTSVTNKIVPATCSPINTP